VSANHRDVIVFSLHSHPHQQFTVIINNSSSSSSSRSPLPFIVQLLRSSGEPGKSTTVAVLAY